jgi:aryl-alcohol dehydrogenase-like predicted oxidoreductase
MYSAALITYSPLTKGELTGKNNPDHLPPGLRSRTYNRALFSKIRPLIKSMREIGLAHNGKTPAQVALNWAICKKAIVIPGAKNALQARENLGVLGWGLLDKSSDDVAS